MNKLIEQLKIHEGVKLKPYKCSAGKLTIGVGKNIQDNGITLEEAEYLLQNDIAEARSQLLNSFPWMGDFNDARISAMINFTFNVGIGTVKKFENTLSYMKSGEWDKAADEMMDSRWARQVGNRAVEVTEQIRTGKWG
ncbi:glycoside hydrolase family protein [Emcibacteraceae bacterium]|nr:glycoside hydrolase family protein [Emcibacteraceae bacterium]